MEPKKARRGHNEGTIYERKNKDGKVIGYQAQLTTSDDQGNTVRRTVTGKTKTETKRKFDELKAAWIHGSLGPRQSQTVAEYLESWLATSRSSVKPSTYNAYRLNVRRLTLRLGKIRLDALTPAHVQSCYTALSQRLAPRTVRQVHVTLHKALTDALALGVIGRNVTEGVRLPRVPHSEQSWYTIEQLDHVFQATVGDRFHALWVVLGTTGLRLGEVLGLQWQDINLSAGILTVKRQLQRDRAE